VPLGSSAAESPRRALTQAERGVRTAPPDLHPGAARGEAKTERYQALPCCKLSPLLRHGTSKRWETGVRLEGRTSRATEAGLRREALISPAQGVGGVSRVPISLIGKLIFLFSWVKVFFPVCFILPQPGWAPCPAAELRAAWLAVLGAAALHLPTPAPAASSTAALPPAGADTPRRGNHGPTSIAAGGKPPLDGSGAAVPAVRPAEAGGQRPSAEASRRGARPILVAVLVLLLQSLQISRKYPTEGQREGPMPFTVRHHHGSAPGFARNRRVLTTLRPPSPGTGKGRSFPRSGGGFWGDGAAPREGSGVQRVPRPREAGQAPVAVQFPSMAGVVGQPRGTNVPRRTSAASDAPSWSGFYSSSSSPEHSQQRGAEAGQRGRKGFHLAGEAKRLVPLRTKAVLCSSTLRPPNNHCWAPPTTTSEAILWTEPCQKRSPDLAGEAALRSPLPHQHHQLASAPSSRSTDHSPVLLPAKQDPAGVPPRGKPSWRLCCRRDGRTSGGGSTRRVGEEKRGGVFLRDGGLGDPADGRLLVNSSLLLPLVIWKGKRRRGWKGRTGEGEGAETLKGNTYSACTS